MVKPVVFAGDALECLRAFPADARRTAGFQVHRLQQGLEPNDFKSMQSIGPGAFEIRVRSRDGAFRVVYVAKWTDGIWILHCFQKKTRSTAQRDLELAARRYREVAGRQP